MSEIVSDTTVSQYLPPPGGDSTTDPPGTVVQNNSQIISYNDEDNNELVGVGSGNNNQNILELHSKDDNQQHQQHQDENTQQDILSNNTQLDNISNMAEDDLESFDDNQHPCTEQKQPIVYSHHSNGEDDHSTTSSSHNNESKQNHDNNNSSTRLTTKTSFISRWKKKKVSLCFGRGKIGIVPCLSVVAILLSILALISIALLVALPYQEMKKLPILDLMVKRAGLYSSYIAMRDMLRLGVENRGSYDPYSTYYYYYAYRNSFNQTFTNFTQIIPTEFSHDFLTKSKGHSMLESYPIFTNHWDQMVKKVVSFVVINGTSYYFLNRTIQAQAKVQLYSPLYAQHFNEFQDSFYDLQDKLFEMCNKADNLVKNSGIATLVLVCFSLAVILPTILIIFIFALRRDRLNERKLRSANSFMLKDTMANPNMRLDFKKFCKECKMEIPYLILEKIQYYKEYVLESYDVQMNIYEITNELVRKQSIDISDKNSILVYKVAKEAEKKLVYFERMKYETAFEIVENFHESSENATHFNSSFISLIQETRGVLDLYNNQSDIFEDTDLLPAKLFDAIERQLGQLLATTHMAFKSTSGLNVSKVLNSSNAGDTGINSNNNGDNSKPILLNQTSGGSSYEEIELIQV